MSINFIQVINEKVKELVQFLLEKLRIDQIINSSFQITLVCKVFIKT